MTTGLDGLLAQAPGGRVVWLDSAAYARRLFAPGEDVWAAAVPYVELARRAQQLLASDVIEVRLGDFHRAALARQQAVAYPVRGGRAVRALRELLEDHGPVGVAVDAVSALHHLYTGHPVVLVVESGGHWLRWAAAVTDGTWAGDPDDVDRAALYLADTVRAFACAGVSGIVLDVLGDDTASPDELVELHRPLLNLAEHYHWSTAVRTGAAQLSEGPRLEPVDVVLCPEADFSTSARLPGGARRGGGLDPAFWMSDEAPVVPPGVVVYGQVPEDAYPEQVLSRLATLRSGG